MENFLLLIAQMFQDVRSIDLAAALGGKKRQVAHIADTVHMRAGIDVEDCPAPGRMATPDIELDVFQSHLPVNAGGF